MRQARSAALALLTLALATPALGQAQPKQGRQPAKPAPTKVSVPPTAQPAAKPAAGEPKPGSIEFAQTPFRVNSAGLSMYLPSGAVAQTSGTGDTTSAQIIAPDSSWLVNVQTPQSKDLKSTPTAVAEKVLQQLLGSVGVLDRTVKEGQVIEKVISTKGVVLDPVKEIVIPAERPEEQRPAARFYVRLPRGEGETPVVRGYTVFQVSPGRFVTFDLVTPEPNFGTARAVYETMVATARFADAAAMAAARAACIETGIEFLNNLGPADYDNACAVLKDQWYRLSKPAPGGADADAKEVAYRRVRAHKGFRGEMDPSRPTRTWTAGDRQEGYVVRIDARFLQGDKIVDSVGVYFMTPDRREEGWTLQMVIRDPGARKPSIWREVGARKGSTMRVTTDGSSESKAAQPTVPDKGYINQVEAFLLPQLLVRNSRSDANGRAGEYGFYAYQSEFGNVRLRRDMLAEPQDRAGAWLITTKLNEDRDPQTSLYNERGDLVKSTLPDGSVWTPTTLQRLADLWRAKGLPME